MNPEKRKYVIFGVLGAGRIGKVHAKAVSANPDAKLIAVADAFADAAKKANIDITVSPAMDVERWQKFTFLVGLSGATAAMRQPLGPILADPDTHEFLHNLMREVVAVGRAQGVAIAADYADDRMAFARTGPATMKASLAHDFERGNRIAAAGRSAVTQKQDRQYEVDTAPELIAPVRRAV